MFEDIRINNLKRRVAPQGLAPPGVVTCRDNISIICRPRGSFLRLYGELHFSSSSASFWHYI